MTSNPSRMTDATTQTDNIVEATKPHPSQEPLLDLSPATNGCTVARPPRRERRQNFWAPIDAKIKCQQAKRQKQETSTGEQIVNDGPTFGSRGNVPQTRGANNIYRQPSHQWQHNGRYGPFLMVYHDNKPQSRHEMQVQHPPEPVPLADPYTSGPQGLWLRYGTPEDSDDERQLAAQRSSRRSPVDGLDYDSEKDAFLPVFPENLVESAEREDTKFDDEHNPMSTSKRKQVPSRGPVRVEPALRLDMLNSDGDSMRNGASFLGEEDPRSRRRLQSRIAQRNYRTRSEKTSELAAAKVVEATEEDALTRDEAQKLTIDPEVMAHQPVGEQVNIVCACGLVNDRRFIIPCATCGTWQHIDCCYEDISDMNDAHICPQCGLYAAVQEAKEAQQSRNISKETGMPGTVESVTTSRRNAKTIGAESSVGPTASIADSVSSYAPAQAPARNLKTKRTRKISRATLMAKSSKRASGAPMQDTARKNLEHAIDTITLPWARLYLKMYPEAERVPSPYTNDSSWLPQELVTSIKRGGHESASSLMSALRNPAATFGQASPVPNFNEAPPAPNFGMAPPAPKSNDAPPVPNPDEEPSIVDGDVALDAVIQRAEQLLSSLREQKLPSALEEPWNALHYGGYDPKTNEWSTYRDHDDTDAELEPMKLRDDDGGKYELPDKMELDGDDDSDEEAKQMKLDDDVPQSSENKGLGDYQGVHLLPELVHVLKDEWLSTAQSTLPDAWKWDVEYLNGCWTCTPLQIDVAEHYPLTIGGAPLVLPVQYRWPPIGGVVPPPDPRPTTRIDCRSDISAETVRDLFLTFEGSLGFYVLINGLLQVIVPDDFDTSWAASHLPQRFGGLKVCYIAQDQEPTVSRKTAKTTKKSAAVSKLPASSRVVPRPTATNASSSSTLKLNDYIEARPINSPGKDKYAGRIGLHVARQGDPFLIMSTHVITEALLAKPHRNMLPRWGKGPAIEKLQGDWNEHVEIWAGNEKMGTVHHTYDVKPELGVYPKGFHYDISLISPRVPSSVRDIKSPIQGMGWLNREAWNALRQESSAIKFLSTADGQRKAKTLQCRGPSEIAVIGEGIFLNNVSPGGRSTLRDYDTLVWEDLVSRAVLYRVCPDLDPPNGQSGTALYAEGMRSDGTVGPGIVGFQSFVQRSGHPQNFEVEGPALGERLKRGLVAFYGAFQVPEELQREFVVI